jgi:succinate-semialdehyde dehydrogenase/glutarate-semialdehyde dehydrogenase
MSVQTVNPTTGEVLNTYQVQGADWVEKAVGRSTVAFADWSRRTLTERIGCVQRFESALRREREGLARLMTLEMGKPFKQALTEIDKCASSCATLRETFPVWLREKQYSTSKGHSIRYMPMGPLLGIMPWNFPLWQVVRFAIPALLNGNTILLKHAPNTWGSSEKIESWFCEAFPDNVYIHLPIDVPMTEKMIGDSRIRGVSLTGSTRAGSAVGALCGKFLKKCVLELGGSDAYVVFEDADVDRAAQICVEARLQNAGQSCVAAKRFIVNKRHVGAFTEKMVALMAKKRVGDPMLPDSDIGPMARLDLRDGLAEQVKKSIAGGAKVAFGTEVSGGPGFFYPPSVLTNVTPGMEAFDEELFGPVAAVIEAASDREALKLANQSRFGLGGAIFTRDIERAKTLAADDFEAGMIFINDFVKSDALAPFGGIKDSGIGRELGREGCFEFVSVKTILAAAKA